MATFVFTHGVVYRDNDTALDGNPDNTVFHEIVGIGGTISDGDSDLTFEAGDVITGGYASTENERFIGTTVIDGETWPVFYSAFFDEFYIYMTQAPVSPPAMLSVNVGDTYICFAPGTLIATPAGDVAVEALGIGDLVLTEDGRAVPVKWVGRQTLAPRFQRLRLICVAAGALGGGLPARDLVLTADHALMLDGLLVNAGAMVNGTTITEEANLPERVTVYHVETEDHDIILAEGAPAETYVDYAGRQAFDNYAEYLALYGEDRVMRENPAPRIGAARMLPPAIRARLASDRAA